MLAPGTPAAPTTLQVGKTLWRNVYVKRGGRASQVSVPVNMSLCVFEHREDSPASETDPFPSVVFLRASLTWIVNQFSKGYNCFQPTFSGQRSISGESRAGMPPSPVVQDGARAGARVPARLFALPRQRREPVPPALLPSVRLAGSGRVPLLKARCPFWPWVWCRLFHTRVWNVPLPGEHTGLSVR